MKKIILITLAILFSFSILSAQQVLDEVENWAQQQTDGFDADDVVEFMERGKAVGDITFGDEYVFRNSGANFISTTKLDELHFIIAYNGSNGRGIAKVGTIAGNIISYSSEFIFNSESVEYISITSLNATNFVIAYQDFLGASRYGTAIVGTVSGNTISYSSKYVFNVGKSYDCSASTLDDTHFIIAYRDQDNSYSGTAIIGTVSGNSITYGSEHIFDTVGSYDISTDAFDANTFIVAFRGTNTSHGVAIIGSVTGDQIIFGDNHVFNSGYTQYCSVTTMNANQFVIAYRDGGNSNRGTSIVGSVTGTIITLGAEYIFNSVTTDRVSIIKMNATHFIVNYQNEDNSNFGNSKTGTIINDSIIYGNESTFNSGTTYRVSATNINSSKFIVAYQDGDNSNYCTSIIGEVELASPPLSDSLVAHYPFNGNANDESGNNNNGTVTGATLTTDRFGNDNSAYNFDGNDYINFGNSSSLNWQNSDYSVSVWVKRNSQGIQYSSHQVFVGNQLDGGDYRGWFFRFDPDNSLYFASNYNSNFVGNGNVTSTNNVTDTIWHHYCGILDGQNSLIKLYIDGVLNNTDVGSNNYDIDNASDLFIGRKSNGEYFYGKIDDVRIYNRALTAAEVDSLYYENSWDNLTANFTASDTTITLGNTLQFTDLSTGNPTNWQWDFGDGTTDNVQNLTYIYQTAGTYSVSLVVSDGVSSDTLTQDDYITVLSNDDQSIDLNTGWNISSFNIIPQYTLMDSVFNPLITEASLMKVMDESGGLLQEITGSGWTNTIGNMENTEGYYVKVNQNTQLNLSGLLVETPFNIPLSTGWNIMGYPMQDSNIAIEVLQPLIDSSYLTKVLAETGEFIQEIPDAGWINTISYFKAGKGYYLKVNQNCSLTIGREPPLLTTNDVSSITQTTAVCGGEITSNQGSIVTARGVCWSTTANPTLADTYTTDGTGIGAFVSNITGLTANTQYYVRAYAANGEGTEYGDDVGFITSPILPSVTTDNVSSITSTTAISGGDVTSNGGATVTARGVCWSISSNPTLVDSYTTDGSETGIFTSNLSGLTENSTYYLRAYATNSVGTAYGNEVSFTTTSLATVTTDAVTNITATTATSGGNITSNGGASVTARGVCWSTSSNPTLTNSYSTDGTGTSTFVSNITGLTANTQYYVRAYATNSEGTSYGNDVTFTTPPPTLATITTNAVTNITATTATSGGNITSNGGASVTARGVCWSTSSNPTLTDNYTTDGTGTGIFTSNLTGLTENVTYYVRAYATNTIGTVYGDEMSFVATQPPFVNCGDMLTYESQSYTTVQIGSQCWMAENLNVGTMIQGNQSQTNNGQIEKYCYNNDPANCDVYGGLYQWEEMMQYTTTQGVQGICPNDWHLPTDNEWKNMEMQLGMTQAQADTWGWRGTDEGGKLKETGTTHWNSPNTGATNSSSFTALPGGERYSYGLFYHHLGIKGYWWSSTENSSTGAWSRSLHCDGDQVGRYPGAKMMDGFSIRCLKN